MPKIRNCYPNFFESFLRLIRIKTIPIPYNRTTRARVSHFKSCENRTKSKRFFTIGLGQSSWVRICAPNVWAKAKEKLDFAHPIFGPCFMYCSPNIKLLPPPRGIRKFPIGTDCQSWKFIFVHAPYYEFNVWRWFEKNPH